MPLYVRGRNRSRGTSGSGSGTGVTVSAIRSALAGASDADKFDIVSKLHATPEVLYVEQAASEKEDEIWTNVQLTRALVGDDNNKLLVIRFWNSRRTAETSLPVRWFLELTPMDPSADTFGQRAIALPIYSGDKRNDRTFAQGNIDVLYVGRPTESIQTTRRMILGTKGFGPEAQGWKNLQIRIELRSL